MNTFDRWLRRLQCLIAGHNWVKRPFDDPPLKICRHCGKWKHLYD